MEDYTYQYANCMGYVTENPDFPTYKYKNGTTKLKMHMKDLFDMNAGTSTGSILAAGLAIRGPDSPS